MELTLPEVTLTGDLVVPKDSIGVVVFAHGSGSSRHSPRNKMVAKELNQAGHATLLFDLLTPEEDRDPDVRFDIELLTKRLIDVAHFLHSHKETHSHKLGFFGSSTGAAAALKAAATLGQKASAVVSRGGRVDLAGSALPQVLAPTLFIVGSLDTTVLELNEEAFGELACEKKLEVIEGASHLFEEGSSLVQVAHLASKWFTKHF